MYRIETTRLPLLLAQQRIRLLSNSEPRPLPAARPALPHGITARHPDLAVECRHDFLMLTVRPDLHDGP
jgi:hypothetical protein